MMICTRKIQEGLRGLPAAIHIFVTFSGEAGFLAALPRPVRRLKMAEERPTRSENKTAVDALLGSKSKQRSLVFIPAKRPFFWMERLNFSGNKFRRP
jgi:hypothetical protein